MDKERYARQMQLAEIGEAGQRKLSEAAVLIVGLGGLGSPAAAYLVGAGVGRIGLCDPDIVSITNLQRQILYTEDEAGLPKTACAERRLASVSGHTVFEKYSAGLTPGNAHAIIDKYDVVVDCCDNFSTRYLIDDTCARLGKPWVFGAIDAFSGQVAVMNGRNGLRYSALYPDRDELEARPHASGGVLGTLPGVIGAIEAGEAIKLIAGFGDTLDGRLFTINLKTLQTDIIELV